MSKNNQSKGLEKIELIAIGVTSLITAITALIVALNDFGGLISKTVETQNNKQQPNTLQEKNNSLSLQNTKELPTEQKTNTNTEQVRQSVNGTGNTINNGDNNTTTTEINNSRTTNDSSTRNSPTIEKGDLNQNNKTECIGGGTQTNCTSGGDVNNNNSFSN